jgi:hypothetical protein
MMRLQEALVLLALIPAIINSVLFNGYYGGLEDNVGEFSSPTSGIGRKG